MSERADTNDVPPASRVVIVGAAGLLGSALMRGFALTSGFEAIGLDRGECDVTDACSIRQAVCDVSPHVVINCAAFTRVDDCEAQVDLAFSINGRGAGNVADAARTVAARMIHISTDYVFDGAADAPIAEDARTGPPELLSVYGRSKLEGEHQVLAAHAEAVIVRTAWMYGHDAAGFPDAILRQARTSRTLRVVNDQTGSPTYAEDLAAAIVRIALSDARGIYHVTNTGKCTWYEFAREILERAGIHDVLIEPVSTSAFPRPARRPAFSVLDNARFNREIGPPLRPWREAGAAYMAAVRAKET